VELASRDLVKRRVLEVAGEREYRFSIELFRRWVQQNKPLREVKDEIDQLDPVAALIFQKGNALFQKGQWEDAVRHFQDALERNPHHFRARLYMGEALLELGKIDEAVVELEQAYELDQDDAKFALIRGLLSQAKARNKAGHEEGALRACERVLEISPHEQSAQTLRAAILRRRGEASPEKGLFMNWLSKLKVTFSL